MHPWEVIGLEVLRFVKAVSAVWSVYLPRFFKAIEYLILLFWEAIFVGFELYV